MGSRGSTVLARVGEPRHDGRDPLGRRELRRLDHEQELHEVAVDRCAARLDNEDVGAADRLVVAAVRLVRERLQLDLSQLHPELLGDPQRQLLMGAPEHHQPLRGPTLDPVPRLRLRPLGVHGHVQAGVGRRLSRGGFHRHTLPLFSCRARAMAKAPGGTSSVITDPAATHALSPIVTGARNELSTPVLTLRPIVVRRCLPWPSSCGKLAVMFPAAIFASSPMSASPTYDRCDIRSCA